MTEAIIAKDAQEWIEAYDQGLPVATVEMGGLGSAAYEHCIQTLMAEVLRILITKQYDHSEWLTDADKWEKDLKEIDNLVCALPEIDALGLSGAQFGAGINLALNFYRYGPATCLEDEELKDRLIQVTKTI